MSPEHFLIAFCCFEACIVKPPQLPNANGAVHPFHVQLAESRATRYEWRDPWSARLGGSWDTVWLKRFSGKPWSHWFC
eukprot:s1571_g17.t1